MAEFLIGIVHASQSTIKHYLNAGPSCEVFGQNPKFYRDFPLGVPLSSSNPKMCQALNILNCALH